MKKVLYGTMDLMIQKIKTLSEAKGLNQTELAEIVGVTPSRVSRWFDGTGTPSGYHLIRIARGLGVTMEYLADDSMDDPPTKTDQPDGMKSIMELIEDLGPRETLRRLALVREIEGDSNPFMGRTTTVPGIDYDPDADEETKKKILISAYGSQKKLIVNFGSPRALRELAETLLGLAENEERELGADLPAETKKGNSHQRTESKPIPKKKD